MLAWNRPQLPTALIFLPSIHFAKLAGKKAWRVCALPEQTKAHMAKHVERASCAASKSHSETREISSRGRETRHCGGALPPPSPDDFQHFMRVAAKMQLLAWQRSQKCCGWDCPLLRSRISNKRCTRLLHSAIVNERERESADQSYLPPLQANNGSDLGIQGLTFGLSGGEIEFSICLQSHRNMEGK